ncbi:MAG: FAD-binding protein [Ilumatobacter sp.]|uniref:FAD-binding protein n=1 Tax=Ilumatobacter sp. TaxID=1967498 RepID=UPI0032999C57
MPSSLEQLSSIVASCVGISSVASRHSFNRIGDGEVLVDLRDIPQSIEFDESAGTVSSPASTTFAELSGALDTRGRALHNLASLPHISIGGAISTATHGSGSTSPCLASAVRELDLLTATGEVRSFRRGDDDFLGTVVALGSLGLVTRVVLQTEPTYEVSQTVHDGLAWTTLVESFDDVFASASSVSVFTRWGDVAGELWRKQRSDDRPPSRTDIEQSLVPADAMRHPIPGNPPDACTRQLGERGPWWNRLPHFRADAVPSAGSEIQSECFVERTASAAAIEAIRSIGPELDDVLLVSEIRTVAADDFWMSPFHERDSTGLHFTWKLDPAAVQAAVDRVALVLAPFDVRWHVGKAIPTGWRLERPGLGDFLDLKHRLDPTGRFTTDWFRSNVERSV